MLAMSCSKHVQKRAFSKKNKNGGFVRLVCVDAEVLTEKSAVVVDQKGRPLKLCHHGVEQEVRRMRFLVKK